MLLSTSPVFCQTRSAAANPEPPYPPLSFKGLLAGYLSTRPDLRADAAFAKDWMYATKCTDWGRVYNDEFRADKFRAGSAAELAASNDEMPALVEIRLNAELGRYDAATQEFAFRPASVGTYFPVFSPGYFGEQQRNISVPSICSTEGGAFPLEFDVALVNPEATWGLPMAASAAESFAAARTYPNGSRNNATGVVLTVKLTVKSVAKIKSQWAIAGTRVAVDGEIIAMTVNDANSVPKTFYRLDATRLAERNVTAIARRNEEAAAAAVPEFNAALLVAQFADTLKRGFDTKQTPSRLVINNTISTTANPDNSRTFGLQLDPRSVFRPSGMAVGLGLEFDNIAEVTSLNLPAALAEILAKGYQSQQISLLYIPVGASNDKLKAGELLTGHIVSVDVLLPSLDGKRFSVPISVAKAASDTTDRRPGRAFDIFGIHLSMTPDEVKQKVGTALGQTLIFDPRALEQRSPGEACATINSNQQQVGQQCVIARYTATPGGMLSGTRYALAELKFHQVLANEEASALVKGLDAKWGHPDLTARFTGLHVFGMLPLFSNGNAEVATWGERLSDQRVVADQISLPQHPFEVVLETEGELVVATITLIATGADVPLPAPPPKLAEPIKPKF